MDIDSAPSLRHHILKDCIYISISMNKYNDFKSGFLEPQVDQYGSHMVMTNVTKPMKTKYINIDTRFCDEDFMQTRSSSFQITLPERIQDVYSIQIQSIELPNSFFHISAKMKNNTFKYNEDLITVSDGFYTTTDSLVRNFQ